MSLSTYHSNYAKSIKKKKKKKGRGDLYLTLTTKKNESDRKMHTEYPFKEFFKGLSFITLSTAVAEVL